MFYCLYRKQSCYIQDKIGKLSKFLGKFAKQFYKYPKIKKQTKN